MRNGRQEGQHRSHCKPCASEASLVSQALRRERDPEGFKAYKAASKRRQRRGITEDEFDEIGETQNWRCAICNEDISDKAFLDHDHKTGKVRKLLCFNCNVGLGHFRDSIALLDRGIVYLTEHDV